MAVAAKLTANYVNFQSFLPPQKLFFAIHFSTDSSFPLLYFQSKCLAISKYRVWLIARRQCTDSFERNYQLVLLTFHHANWINLNKPQMIGQDQIESRWNQIQSWCAGTHNNDDDDDGKIHKVCKMSHLIFMSLSLFFSLSPITVLCAVKYLVCASV